VSARLVGLDFDNTLVCYDAIFHRLAVERGAIPESLTPTKTAVRDYLRGVDREELWTELQGVAYGPRLLEAEPYPGALDFLKYCQESGIPWVVVSHKTRRPFVGEPHDLHAAAAGWLDHYVGGMGITAPRYFELTKEAKMARIGELQCTHFVDDLPELLLHPDFPASVRRLLFDPHGSYRGGDLSILGRFQDLPELL
jgi:hypothetical protein